MSDSDYAIQISFKTPSQTLINLRAADEQEVSDSLEILGRQLKTVGEIEAVLAAMSNIYTGLSPVDKLVADAEDKATAVTAGPSTGSSQSTQGTGDVPICQHGPMTFRKGITKTGKNAGKAWSGFMCSGPQGGGQCPPIFDKVARESA